jgi:hypothetical protein
MADVLSIPCAASVSAPWPVRRCRRRDHSPLLLKLGAQVRTSVRRIHFAITSGCPNKDEFELAHIYLQRAFSSA